MPTSGSYVSGLRASPDTEYSEYIVSYTIPLLRYLSTLSHLAKCASSLVSLDSDYHLLGVLDPFETNTCDYCVVRVCVVSRDLRTTTEPVTLCQLRSRLFTTLVSRPRTLENFLVRNQLNFFAKNLITSSAKYSLTSELNDLANRFVLAITLTNTFISSLASVKRKLLFRRTKIKHDRRFSAYHHHVKSAAAKRTSFRSE